MDAAEISFSFKGLQSTQDLHRYAMEAYGTVVAYGIDHSEPKDYPQFS